jgi:hypothetical protein
MTDVILPRLVKSIKPTRDLLRNLKCPNPISEVHSPLGSPHADQLPSRPPHHPTLPNVTTSDGTADLFAPDMTELNNEWVSPPYS